VNSRKHFPGATRPARPALCLTAALEHCNHRFKIFKIPGEDKSAYRSDDQGLHSCPRIVAILFNESRINYINYSINRDGCFGDVSS
jgi:hypothetical protein